MTTITLKTESHGLNILRSNGRLIAVEPRINSIRKVSAGRWEGEASGYSFEIIGGRAAGGSSKEWFVRWDALGPMTFSVGSAAAALRTIENS